MSYACQDRTFGIHASTLACNQASQQKLTRGVHVHAPNACASVFRTHSDETDADISPKAKHINRYDTTLHMMTAYLHDE